MINKIKEKMIVFYKGNLHYIEHFMKVYSYARMIGEMEGLDSKTQSILEMAAIVHDISIPTCYEKYGEDSGPTQEKESGALLRPFLEEFRLDEDVEERIITLVCHHHTYSPVLGIDHQILLEADFLVNASEHKMSRGQVENFIEKFTGTGTGKRLLKEIYLV